MLNLDEWRPLNCADIMCLQHICCVVLLRRVVWRYFALERFYYLFWCAESPLPESCLSDFSQHLHLVNKDPVDFCYVTIIELPPKYIITLFPQTHTLIAFLHSIVHDPLHLIAAHLDLVYSVKITWP